MAYEYTTITIDLTGQGGTGTDGTLYAELFTTVTLANNDTVPPRRYTATVTSGAGSIVLPCTATAIKGTNAPFRVSFTPTSGAEVVLGRIIPTESATAVQLSDLLEVGGTSAQPVTTYNVDATTLTISPSIAQLQAMRGLSDGLRVLVQDVGIYRYSSSSAATSDEASVVTPASATGRWLLEVDGASYRQGIDIRAFGAISGADSTAAIQAALNAPATGQRIFIPPGTWLISSPLVIGIDNITIEGVYGQSILKAADGANFENVIYATGRSGLRVANIVVDVNQAGRAASLTTRSNGINFVGVTDCVIETVIAKNAIGSGGGSNIPGIGIGVAGSSVRCRIIGCTALNCGISNKAADGFFTSGTQILTVGCTAKSCLDTAFVIESSQQSGISGCTALSCGVGAAITNASAATSSDNFISGLTAYDWTATVTGGIQIGNPDSATTGNLVNTSVSNVVLRNATGTGPGINIRKTGTAKTVGLLLSNVVVDGAGAQGILLDAEDVTIAGCKLAATGSPIQVAASSERIFIRGNQITSVSTYGIVTGASVATLEITDNYIKGDGSNTSYGIYCGATCTGVRTAGNTITGVTISPVGSAASTAPRSSADPVFMESVPAAAGDGIWPLGTIIFDSTPNVAGPVGWKVTTAGVAGSGAVFTPLEFVDLANTQTGIAGNKSWSGTQDVANAIRTTGGTTFGSGAGVTMFYSAGTGYVRSASEGVAFTPLIVQGSTYALEIGGSTAYAVDAARDFLASGNMVANVVGKGLKVAEGSNATMGLATLVGGTVTVNTTKVTANSRIFLTGQTDGGTPGWQRVSARTAATSFTITSSSGTDTSTVAWLIVEPI